MKLILDTCTFLWLASAEHRLSATAVELIRDPDHRVLLSAASAWEISIKHALGRLPLPQRDSRRRGSSRWQTWSVPILLC